MLISRIQELFSSGHDKSRTRLAYIFILLGASIALLASIVLSVDAIEIAKNKDAALACNINEVLNCAAVGSSKAASVIPGIPNSFFGMVTLPVMITIAVAGLAGSRFADWFMKAASAGVLIGLVFAAWMLYESMYVIQVLCPWCLTLDVGMLLLAFGFWRYVLNQNLIKFSKITHRRLVEFSKNGYDILILVLAYVLITAAIIVHFGDALFS